MTCCFINLNFLKRKQGTFKQPLFTLEERIIQEY